MEDTPESTAAAAQLEAIWWDSWANDEQLDHYDYLGFSYYSADRRARRRVARAVAGGRQPGPQGYVRWAEGFAHVLDRLSADHPNRPILISEAGIGTDDDQQRNDYVEAVLDIARDAIIGGVDLRGIFWWTGVDNYEWGQGFDVRFGLFDRDRNPKPAAEIARQPPAADDDLWRFCADRCAKATQTSGARPSRGRWPGRRRRPC